MGLVSITVGITVERPSFLCDYCPKEKNHRPGISSLLLTLELCSVALSFALPYLRPPTREVCITVHHRASPRLSSPRALASSRNDHCSPHVQRKKNHRPAKSSLLLTLELCSVALSFALPYLRPPTREVCITVHHRASPRLSSPRALASSRNDHCSPHTGPNLPEPPQIVALIF